MVWLVAERRTHFIMFTADVSKRQRGLEPGRKRCRRDFADHLAVVRQLGSGLWYVVCVKANAAELLVDVPHRVDPGDRLLAQVTAFDKTDRLAIAVDLLRQVRIGNVDAISRRALFDPGRFDGLTAARHSAGFAECLPDRGNVGAGTTGEESLGANDVDAPQGHGLTGDLRFDVCEAFAR